MKKAKVFSITSGDGRSFVWKWRCLDTKVESKDVFTMYFDCVADARKQGYEVDLAQAQGPTAPSSA